MGALGQEQFMSDCNSLTSHVFVMFDYLLTYLCIYHVQRASCVCCQQLWRCGLVLCLSGEIGVESMLMCQCKGMRRSHCARQQRTRPHQLGFVSKTKAYWGAEVLHVLPS